jgi:hypothetical protein
MANWRKAPSRGEGRRSRRRPILRPHCGTHLGACKYVITDAEVEGNWVATALYFCYNGGAVTYVTPTGGDTNIGIGGGWGFVDFDRYAYCCVGNYHWYMAKIANFVQQVDWFTWRHDCVQNEIHLYGNGTVIKYPGWWNRWTAFTNQTDCALGPG